MVGCRASSVDHMPSTDDEGREYKDFKAKTQEAQHKASDAAKVAKEASESWTGWAKEKISEGLGLKQDEAIETATKASDDAAATAKKTKDKIQEVVSGNELLIIC